MMISIFFKLETDFSELQGPASGCMSAIDKYSA